MTQDIKKRGTKEKGEAETCITIPMKKRTTKSVVFEDNEASCQNDMPDDILTIEKDRFKIEKERLDIEKERLNKTGTYVRKKLLMVSKLLQSSQIQLDKLRTFHNFKMLHHRKCILLNKLRTKKNSTT